MWLVAADIARFVDYVSVCLIVWYTGELCKTAEPMDTPSGKQNFIDRVNHLLDWGAHWRYLTNTSERCCGGDAALGQITLTTCDRLNVIALYPGLHSVRCSSSSNIPQSKLTPKEAVKHTEVGRQTDGQTCL